MGNSKEFRDPDDFDKISLLSDDELRTRLHDRMEELCTTGKCNMEMLECTGTKAFAKCWEFKRGPKYLMEKCLKHEDDECECYRRIASAYGHMSTHGMCDDTSGQSMVKERVRDLKHMSRAFGNSRYGSRALMQRVSELTGTVLRPLYVLWGVQKVSCWIHRSILDGEWSKFDPSRCYDTSGSEQKAWRAKVDIMGELRK